MKIKKGFELPQLSSANFKRLPRKGKRQEELMSYAFKMYPAQKIIIDKLSEQAGLSTSAYLRLVIDSIIRQNYSADEYNEAVEQ